MEIHRTIYI